MYTYNADIFKVLGLFGLIMSGVNDVFLAECTHNGFSTVSSSCAHGNDVAVSCTQESKSSQ